MNINRHNYEAFFLDHLEGQLSRGQEKELQEFLAANPDLAAELDDFETVHIEKEKIVFSGKTGIKKDENELTPVTQLIALMEGDLSVKEAAELKKKIESDKYLKAQSELLQKTKLVPDLSIRFADKNKLKHSGRVVYMWRYAAVAAVLIIGLTIAFRNIRTETQNRSISHENITAPVTTPPSATNNTANAVIKKEEVIAEQNKPVLQPSLHNTSTAKKETGPREKVKEQMDAVPALAANEIITPAKDEPVPAEHALKTENTQPVFASNTFSYKDVFTEEEWNELHNMSVTEQSSRVQQLAKEGMNRLGEITGVKVQKQKNAFEFSVGNFGVRHVSGK